MPNKISERVIEAMSLNHSAALQMKTNNQTNVQFKTFEVQLIISFQICYSIIH